MDWKNERYVRLYCRDTVEWEMLCWEARALWPNLLRKVDRAGILPLGRHGVRGLAALVKLPVDIVEAGLAGLLEDGCLVQEGEILLVPNFIEAQESKQSDRQRQEESRARRRAIETAAALRDLPSQPVTAGHIPSQSVTNRDSESQNVTECHDLSQPVTIGHSVPCRAVPYLQDPPIPPTASPQGDPPRGKRERKARAMTPEAERIQSLIAEATGAAPHPPSAFDKLIRGIESGSLTPDDAEAMVQYLASNAADGYWRKRGIPPPYVFAPRHVSEILPLAKGWKAGTLRTQSKPSAPNPYRLVTD